MPDGRQAGKQYRGVMLPDGMTPLMLDNMAGLIASFEREDEPVLSAGELAVRLFLLAKAGLESRLVPASPADSCE